MKNSDIKLSDEVQKLVDEKSNGVDLKQGIKMQKILNSNAEKRAKQRATIKELVSKYPELSSYLTQLSSSLDNAVNNICEAYGILDLLGNKLSIGGNYKDDMTSEADSVRAVLNILTESIEQVSDTTDSMQFTTFKED